MKTKRIQENSLNSDKEQKHIGITQLTFVMAYSSDY